MNFFEQLGGRVTDAWKKQHFNDSAFAEIASAALAALPPCEHTDYREIVHWVLGTDRASPQDLTSGFGQPPLVLYRNDLFYIEALFWLDASTAIHEHGFEGAFHILEGSSLHCRYDFELKNRINSRFVVGDIRLREVECLMKGDSRPILAGGQFSHSTFHLEKPTVTIVVRTRSNEEVRPQYTYLVPSVACDPVGKRQLLTRQLQLLELLHQAGEPQYQCQVRRVLGRSDIETAFWALDQSHQHLDTPQFNMLLEAAEERHGDIVASFPAVFREMRRAEKISSRCRHIEKPEHRLLLGLLLGVPSRAGIFEFLRRQYDDDPVELITRWVEEMAAAKPSDSAEANALGVHFDESSLLIFRCLLEGLSFDAVKQRLEEEYDPEDVAAQETDLRELFSALQNSALFQPLFAGDEASPFEISGRRWKPATAAERMAARAEAATRGLVASCFLDAPPVDFIPARALRMMSDGANGESIVNPTFRYEAGPGEGTNDRPQESFLHGFPLAWIENPGTEIRTPFCARGEQAALVAELRPAEAPPRPLDQATRETLALANILVSPDYVKTRREQWERLCDEKRPEFQSQGYAVLRHLIDPLPLAAMRRYYRSLVASGSLALGDGQVERRYSLHSEPLARFFHQQLSKLVTRIAGEPVKPSYVFFAAYEPGAVLDPHLDRAQCQFSISFLADYIPEPEDVCGWPLYVKRQDASATPTAVHLGVGDGVVYKGCELIHYREALPENHFSTSIFFHFVPEDFQEGLE